MKTKLLTIAGIALLSCFFNSVSAQNTPGTLTFTLTAPKHTTGNYETNGRYAMAIWIETNPSAGATAFVKTKLINWGGGTSNTGDHLPTWKTKSVSNVVDATSGATSVNFAARSITWNGTNVAGTIVADGPYRVAVQETWGHGTATVTRYFPFVKGTVADVQTPTADTNFTTISLNWTATNLATNVVNTDSPEAKVYPNPTNGIVKVDFKNEINDIKVINLLGQQVYNQKVENSIGTTKTIDLSSFENGVYMLYLSNDKGATSYEIVKK